MVDAKGRARLLRRRAALRRRGRARRRRRRGPRALRRLHRRGRRALVVPEVAVLQAARLPGGHLPRRAARAPERGRRVRHAAGRPGVGRVPRPRARRRAQLVPLPLRAPDRGACTASRRCARCWTGRASSTRTCAPFAKPNAREGVGVSEAPRGTLMHHYRINDEGLVTWANLIIATGHNSLAHEPGRAAGGEALRRRQPPHRRRAQPRRGGRSAPSTRASVARRTRPGRWPCTCS